MMLMELTLGPRPLSTGQAVCRFVGPRQGPADHRMQTLGQAPSPGGAPELQVCLLLTGTLSKALSLSGPQCPSRSKDRPRNPVQGVHSEQRVGPLSVSGGAFGKSESPLSLETAR